jgi:hypothetical protein
VDWPGLGANPVAAKEQPRPRLIYCAANNHRLEQRAGPTAVPINSTAKLRASERD